MKASRMLTTIMFCRFLDVPVGLNHQLPAEPHPPLGPVGDEQPADIHNISGVSGFNVSVGQGHLLRHDHRNALHCAQLSLQQSSVGA
jgi:hypothetical protein